MGSHISSLLKNFSSEVFYKLVPKSYFLKISVKLHWVIDPTHEQIKSIQSIIKSTQVWSSSKNFFSSFMQMDFHISSLLKNFYSQVLCKLVPMFSFLRISMELQVADLTHEQIKSIQSSIKSTQVWSSIKNFFLQTNPLPTNPIDSNQLKLKFWLEINHALEASWKYLSNHVWWCCVILYFCVLSNLLMMDWLQILNL
jgi:hypothetical protein